MSNNIYKQYFDLFNGSFPWILVSIVGGVVVVLVLGFLVLSQLRKSSDSNDRHFEDNFKPLEESVQIREEDDFIPAKKISSKLGYDTKHCDYCGEIIEEGVNFCVSCGRKL